MTRFVVAALCIVLFLLLAAASDRPAKDVKIIAHRGASAHAPENTLAAFSKAVELGADIVEMDVHLTRDSQLIVIHDESVDRTTDGKGRVADFTAGKLRQLDAGNWFSPTFTGERIPFLREVFNAIPDPISLLIEVKHGSKVYPRVEERVVDIIRKRKAERRVILKSFDDDILNRLRTLAPDIQRLKIIVTQLPLGIIIERGVSFGTVLNDSVQYLQHHWFGLSRGFVEDAHRRGYKVFVWDVHDEDRMREMIELGIDGIETDYPDRLKKLLQEP